MAAHPAPDRQSTSPRNTPAIVAGISFLFPGLGHLLIGAWTRGAIWVIGLIVISAAGGGIFVLALMVIAAADAYVFARQMTTPPPREQEKR